MIKIYQSKNIFSSILIVIGGAQMRIEFKGGTYGGSQQSNSRYKTNNPNIQKGIETHPDFQAGRIWLGDSIPEAGDVAIEPTPSVSVKETKPSEPILEKNADLPADKTDVKKGEEPKTDNTDPKENIYSEVQNTQQARGVLRELGHTYPAAAKKTDIIAAAKELRLSFPNWVDYNAG